MERQKTKPCLSKSTPLHASTALAFYPTLSSSTLPSPTALHSIYIPPLPPVLAFPTLSSPPSLRPLLFKKEFITNIKS